MQYNITMQRKQMLSKHAPQQPRKLSTVTQLPRAMTATGSWSMVRIGLAGTLRNSSK